MENLQDPIQIEQTFNVPSEKVWHALTDLDEMRQWYFSNIPSFEAKVGFETQFTVQVEDRAFHHQWKVTEVIPQQKIAYEWTFDGYPGRGVSLFELKGNDKETTLRLTATVIEKYPDDIPEFKRESGVAGWNYLLKESLKYYLQSK